MHTPKYALFYDFHTMTACPDVGAAFDADAFADRIQACGVDFVTFHARCNQGNAYYNTRAGTRHPSLTFDLFGELSRACTERGIALGAYFNVCLSHHEAVQHREWTVITPDGYMYKPDRLNPFFRSLCYNTGYGEHILAMAREVVAEYPIAGLFLDGMVSFCPCVCPTCAAEMADLGMDVSDHGQAVKFAEISVIRLAEKIRTAVVELNPEILLYHNGLLPELQRETGTYLECECLPTGGWGYEHLPVHASYLRNYGKPVLNMTGRFHESWGDFGGIRTRASLEYDCYYGLAHGMRPNIGGHFHPRGEINHAVFDLIETVYSDLRRFEHWYDGARPRADIAIIAPDTQGRGVRGPEVTGAVRMLGELHQPFDILTDCMAWDGYQVLVLPDRVTLDPDAAAKVRRHLDAGGAIIASDRSGLTLEGDRFALDDWGLDADGVNEMDPAFMTIAEPWADGLPDMPMALYETGIVVRARPGTETAAALYAPYYNKHWDGRYSYFYTPPDHVTDTPALTVHEKVAHVSFPLFRAYQKHAFVPHRQLFANVLQRLVPRPMLRVDGLPSFGRTTVTEQPGRSMVHLLAYVPELRGPTIQMIEEPIDVCDLRVSLRIDGATPMRAYHVGTDEDLPLSISDGYAGVAVDRIRGYAIVVFEHR